MHMNNSFALITGASSGIGLEIAKNLAARGYNLILTARRTELLEALADEITNKHDVKVDYISCDLSKYDAPKEIFEFCESKNYHVDFLVNNAGYGIKTSFHETSIEIEEDFIRVLGTSVIMLTKLFIPKMLANENGKIMIVSSVAAFAAPSAIQPLYGPIKTFMNRFSDGININYKLLQQYVPDLQLQDFILQAVFKKRWIGCQSLWFFQLKELQRKLLRQPLQVRLCAYQQKLISF